MYAAFGEDRPLKLLVWPALAAFLLSMILVGIQAFVLHAFCRYCLFSAAICFLLMGLVVASPSSRNEARG